MSLPACASTNDLIFIVLSLKWLTGLLLLLLGALALPAVEIP